MTQPSGDAPFCFFSSAWAKSEAFHCRLEILWFFAPSSRSLVSCHPDVRMKAMGIKLKKVWIFFSLLSLLLLFYFVFTSKHIYTFFNSNDCVYIFDSVILRLVGIYQTCWPLMLYKLFFTCLFNLVQRFV